MFGGASRSMMDLSWSGDNVVSRQGRCNGSGQGSQNKKGHPDVIWMASPNLGMIGPLTRRPLRGRPRIEE
jgi:hypothetical protein